MKQLVTTAYGDIDTQQLADRPAHERGLRGRGMWISDLSSFLRAWMADPLRVAAIVPSSGALAQMITAEITAASAPVIELGPGTGVFTRQLLARGIPEERLALVEYGSAFIPLLAYRFPAARVVWMHAAQLSSVWRGTRGCCRERIAFFVHDNEAGHDHPRRGFWLPSARRCVLSVHLWPDLSRSSRGSRSARSRIRAHRSCVGERATRGGLSHPPANAEPVVESDHGARQRRYSPCVAGDAWTRSARNAPRRHAA